MVGTRRASPHPRVVALVLLLSATAVFGEEDRRDARAAFESPSVGVFGHFDRIHVKDPGAEVPVNSLLTCFGWGVFGDWTYLALKVGIRSQLGTSSLNPGYVDDEQLVATGELQVKYPLFLGRWASVFPTLGLEYATLVSGTLRNPESYFPWLVRLGAGGQIELTDHVSLGFEANFAPIQGTFYSVAQSLGMRL